MCLRCLRLAALLIDGCDPCLTLTVCQFQDVVVRPAQMYRQMRYLPTQAVEGVADYSPNGGISTSNSWPQLGQTASVIRTSTSFNSR